MAVPTWWTRLSGIGLSLCLVSAMTSTADLSATQDIQHRLSASLNPGCEWRACQSNDSALTIVNVTILDEPAQAHQHHWLWSVLQRPAIQVALTQTGARARIDWSTLLDPTSSQASLGYDQAPDYSAAFMLSNLIEYDDIHDRAVLTDGQEAKVRVYPVAHFNWTRVAVENTTERLAYAFLGQNYTDPLNPSVNLSGILNITLSAYANEGFGYWLPHLSNSESTNQFDIQLDQLHSNSGFNRSRFALEFYVVSRTEHISKLHRDSTHTLDDEHTPGIFKTQELIIPGFNDTLQAYLQWRPVVYTTRVRDLSGSTDVNVTNAIEVANPVEELRSTVLYAMYGEELGNFLVTRINVTMGAPKDGFFKKTKYHAWTFTFGTGEPIHNGFSPMIILVITIIFGILLLVCLTASIICIVKRVRRRRRPANYGRLQN